ncbi:hypothetical protein LOTGIDRAFT_161999 [Lottia gigantea]|uniref:Uncharacterized protein n=1 Tax=Lottia gigantea TaxID=225164 RepID=V4A8C6_LOTGI|nr:hypothetical protein LOTGIDRAFT_161999 [Lottia gigantea]ESO92972.1 hypothetical protein LOTGIDRAFT_161999 [Lottia gigantea]
MANKFGLGSLSLENKKPNTTVWINKAKPYFVDQIGDTLQGDLDMNNFKVTNLKSPENDNDAVHKKYLREQINSIEVNKNHLEDKIKKKTFKGYSNDKIAVEDYIRLASGHDVTNEFKKVVIPKDDDKQKKVFRSYLNLVKRKAPDDEGIMYPYGDKDDLSLDENYEFDDCDYLTIQEENEDC